MSKGASNTIRTEMKSLNGVTEEPHRFGGVEFRLGKRELGHIHGDTLVDIPFPLNVRNELVEKGEVEKHHILPDSGWISFYIRREDDVARAIALLRRSYDIAVESAKKREGQRAKSEEHRALSIEL